MPRALVEHERTASASRHCEGAQREDCDAKASDTPAQDDQRLAFIQHEFQILMAPDPASITGLNWRVPATIS
jgi:hypothetical protein